MEGLTSSFTSLSAAGIGLTLILFSWLHFKRRWAYYQLSSGECNLPTVLWTPRFINYNPISDDSSNFIVEKGSTLGSVAQKMGSSAITNILPRMKRLDGPYGMYGTVYGLSTKVVHIAHPIPAQSVLMNKERQTGSIQSSKSSESPLQKLHNIFKWRTRRKRNSQKKEPIHGSVKAPAYDHFQNFSGDGVFTSDGSVWRKKRSSVIHCLLKGCAKEDTIQFLRLEKEANRAADTFISLTMEAKQRKKYMNVVPLLQRCTVELIYRLITHHNMDFDLKTVRVCKESSQVGCTSSTEGKRRVDSASMEDECDLLLDTTHYTKCSSEESSLSSRSSTSSTSPIHDDMTNHSTKETYSNLKSSNKKREVGTTTCHQELISSYLEAVTHIRMIILAQSRSIWYLLPRWMYRTFSSMFREEERHMAIIRQFARSTCQQAQSGSPLHMLRSRQSHNTNMDPKVIDGTIVNKDLLEEAITLLFAGQDTSAATLSWTLHLLSLHPKVKKKLAQEIDAVIHESTTPDNRTSSSVHFTKKMISKMQYLDAVIKESMRLYPVAPFVVRRLTQDLEVEMDGGNNQARPITIPGDTFACVWIYSLHRNEKLWHQPNEFNPERWIDPRMREQDAAQVKYNMAYMPFAAGPRNCVGQPLAHVILRIVLARIIYKYDISDEQMDKLTVDNVSEDESVRNPNVDKCEMSISSTNEHSLRKDMQAGFTILPSGGVWLSFQDRSKNE